MSPWTQRKEQEKDFPWEPYINHHFSTITLLSRSLRSRPHPDHISCSRGKGWRRRKTYVGSCTSLHRHHSGPRAHLPELDTPAHTLPSQPSQRGKWAEMSNITERGLCSLEQGRLPPWVQDIPARGQEVERTALNPLKVGTLSSSPHQPRQAGTTSQTALERNKLVLLIPYTPATSPLSVGCVHIQVLKVRAGNLLLSQSHSENICLPQRSQPPDLRGSGDRKEGNR